MELINVGLRLLAISQLVLFALMIIASKNPIRVRLVTVLLMLSIIDYLLMPLLKGQPFYSSSWWFLASIAPSLLLMMVWFIFEEDCTLPSWLIVIVSFGVLTSLWSHFNGMGLSDSPIWLQVSKALIAIIAAVVVWAGRIDDLIESRTKARNYLALALCLITVSVLVVNIVVGFSTTSLVDLVELSVILGFSFHVNYLFIRHNPQYQLMAEPAKIRDESDDPVISELLDRMLAERLYADHDLRLAGLASILKVPEYKLRAKINQQLGYRNFNHFVNRYRIEEAGARLREDTRMPVLSIALDVGFRSISSFNSAFQAQFGVSPTVYRAEIQAAQPKTPPKS